MAGHEDINNNLNSEVSYPHFPLTNRQVHPKRSFYSRYLKRFFDIVISFFAVVITLPINAVLAIITFFDVGRPIMFRQKRPGKDCKMFVIYKFRNMNNNTDENGVLLPPSERITKFGKFVRAASLDELLNFWSILKGDMSLIGPRPLLPEYLPFYDERQIMRHTVRPGLECPPIRANEYALTWEEQFENDVWYVENVSFATDCKMIFKIVRMIFDRKATKVRSGALRGYFEGSERDYRSKMTEKSVQED